MEADFLQNFQCFQGILAKSLENLTFFCPIFQKSLVHLLISSKIERKSLKKIDAKMTNNAKLRLGYVFQNFGQILKTFCLFQGKKRVNFRKLLLQSARETLKILKKNW